MKPSLRFWLAAAVLAAATLACNAPVRLSTPETLFPTSTVDQQAQQVAQLQTQIATLSQPALVNPTDTPSTLLPTNAEGQVGGGAPSYTPVLSTPTLTPSATMTLGPGTPTAPPTLTPRASATKTPAAMPGPTKTATKKLSATPLSQRTLAFAPYFTTPPVLDGMWDEWKDHSAEYPARFVTFGLSNWTGAQDLEGAFHVGWDDKYLYLAVKVKDDIYVQNASGTDLYKGDSLEILFDRDYEADKNDHALTDDDFQVGISPGRGDVNGQREAYLWFPRAVAGSRDVKIASQRQNGVTRIEAAVPWSVLKTTPILGDRYGFVLSISDNDNPQENAQQSLASNVVTRVLVDPTTWGMLVLDPAQ